MDYTLPTNQYSPDTEEYVIHEAFTTFIIGHRDELALPHHITRNMLRTSELVCHIGEREITGQLLCSVIESTFGKFSTFKNIYFGIFSPADDYLSSTSDDVYIIVGVMANELLHKQFWNAIKVMRDDRKAKIVALPISPVIASSFLWYPPEIASEADVFTKRFQVNSNLLLLDVGVKPTQINPLTGLGRFGQKRHSLIVSAPKMFMRTEPVGNDAIPHVLYTSGTVSKCSSYSDQRIGYIAGQDHTIGALVVEVSGDTFHIRQLFWNEKDSFFDLNRRYYEDKVKTTKLKAFVMPDLHPGSEDKQVIDKWVELIHLTKPDYVFEHDWFDGASINHHAEGDLLYLCRTRDEAFDTLQKELDYFCDFHAALARNCPDQKFVMVPSNHPAWVDIFLSRGKYALPEYYRDHVLSLELAQALIKDGINPIRYYFEKHYPRLKSRFIWPELDEDFFIGGRQNNIHGHKGVGGSRGSFSTIEASWAKAVHGHTHSPYFFRGVACVGTSTKLKAAYNKGEASRWLNTAALEDEDGFIQLINVIQGEYTTQKISRTK